MNPPRLALAGCMVSLVALAADAQPRAAAPANPDAAAEDKLMSTLATREMDGLLEYYFKKHNIPPDKQAAIKGIVAWREMANPSLPAGRRRALLQDGIRGIKTFLDSTRDTEALLNRAGQLIEYGMKGQINQIEYFGETPARQAELNEAAEAAVKVLDKTIEECEAQETQALAGQTRPSPTLLQKWQALDDRLQNAKWTKAFASYGLALSLDPANPRRKEIADAALTFLKDFEDPSFQREVAVKTQMAKLCMTKADFDGAIAKLDEATKVQGIDKEGQYNALFYTTLAYLLARNENAAVKSLESLQTWISANLKGDEQKFVSASVGLLDYRINELRSELAKNPEDKKKFAQAGEAALSKLMKENPRLEPVIKKMLLEKLPADADLEKLDTVLLRALMAKGVDEVLRAKDGLADDKGKPILERALAAAAIVQKRAGQPNATEDVIDEASFFESVFNLKLGRNNETIEESLDYIKNHGKNKDRAANALANALEAVNSLRKSPDSANPKAGELINRTWKLAVDSGHKEYAFVYGKRLLDQAKSPADYKQAAEALHQVPENHPAVTYARFYELTAMQFMLEDKNLVPASRANLIAEIQKLAADVNRRIDAALASAKEEQKPRLRYNKASATILAADLMQKELKDNQGVLNLLNGFEAAVKGLPGEERLIGTALHLRVSAFMALNQTQAAVDEVQKLVAQGGTGAANILFTLISQMDDAYAKAKLKGDTEAMKQNSAAQVALIGPLIRQTSDPKAKEAYQEWEAQLLIRTARVETDPARRTGYLSKAQGVFSRELAKAAEGSPKHDTLRYQLALISYELKDYEKVQQEMGQLIADGKLGPPVLRETTPDGGETFKDNPIYWEGLLRFMQSNWELSKANPADKALASAVNEAKGTLQSLYINRGGNVGGDRLRDEYAKLKAEMLPGWDEAKIAATQPAKKD